MRMDKAVELGVRSRPALLAEGHTDADLRRLVRRGELIVLRRGWFAVPDADPEAMAAGRRFGALSGPSALRKHGLWVPPNYESVHVRAGKEARRRGRDCCRPPGPPLPVTSILDPFAWALASAAGCMADRHWIAVADSAMNSQCLDEDLLRAMMPATNKLIDTLLAECDPRSQSGTETMMRVELLRRGHDVKVQAYVSGVGFVDLRIGRLIIECDSKLYHTSLEAYRNDRRRDRVALRQGYTTLRLTYDDVLWGWVETLEDIEAILANDNRRLLVSGDN